MKLAAILACRNQSSRLYAKPLQNLDVKKNISILQYMISQIKLYPAIGATVLAISEQKENTVYADIAAANAIPHVFGDDNDVLGRLIKGAEKVGADHILRVTTESPYFYFDNLDDIWEQHVSSGADYSSTSGLPDGSFFEIISCSALKKSWDEGLKKHRSELCTLYIFENKDKFKIVQHQVPEKVRRTNDIRLTVDWPEDLIVLRKVYEDLGLSPGRKHSLEQIIHYLDTHPKINAINNWIDSGIGRIWY